MRLGQLEAPKLNTQNAFAQLGQYMQDKIDRDYKQKQLAIDNSYRDKKFNHNVSVDNQNLELNQNKFNHSVNQDNIDNTYRDSYFDFLQNKNDSKNNQWERMFQFKQDQANKPVYKSFNGVNTDGKPVLSVFNQNDGSVVNTGQEVYQKPTAMTPYQQENIRLRQDAAELKNKQSQLKAIETLSAVDNWDNLSLDNQQKMIDYYNKTGLTPKIVNPWFNDAYPDIPLSAEQKKIKEQQLAEDMKILMQ